MADQRALSEALPKGSKLVLREPENNIGSCGMIDILERRSCSPIVLMSIPSIKILPSGSVSRKRAAIMVDFPAPLRPKIPIF